MIPEPASINPTGAECATCGSELVLLTRDGEPIPHPTRGGVYKVRCERCGIGGVSDPAVLEAARRVEEPVPMLQTVPMSPRQLGAISGHITRRVRSGSAR